MPTKLKYFRAAANNNLEYISEKLQKHPEILDASNPLTDDQTLYFSMVGLVKTLGWGGATLAGIAIAPSVAIVTAMAGSYKMLREGHKTDLHIRSRQNWTLLHYAAEYGASNVAVYLIMQGAKTEDGSFRRVAEGYGQKAFIIACDKAIAIKQEMDGKLLQAQNDITLLKEENALLRLILISYTYKFTKLKADFLLLYDKTQALLGEPHGETV